MNKYNRNIKIKLKGISDTQQPKTKTQIKQIKYKLFYQKLNKINMNNQNQLEQLLNPDNDNQQ